MTSRPGRMLLLAVAVVAMLPGSILAAGMAIDLSVDAGQHDRANTPVRTLIQVPDELAKVAAVTLTDASGNGVVAQLTAPDLLDGSAKPEAGKTTRQLHFILPSLAHGKSLRLTGTLSTDEPKAAGAFTWTHQPGEFAELKFADRPVMRYMCKPLDESSEAKRDESYTVYHHLYDPSGTRYVTNGPEGEYPHHRGLFFGYAQCSYEGCPKANTWWCHGDDYLSHEGFLGEEAGPVLARHRLDVGWHGKDKKIFARETREMAVYNVPGGTLVEFATRLRSTVGPVKLDGDAQHAGFQFRAAAEVEKKTAKQTYYLRPDGPGKPGETRNPDPAKLEATPECKNLPFNAMCFVLDGKRYTAVYLDTPRNPKPSWYSEREYGRFGCYFPYELNESKDLTATYRVWLQEGEMTVAQAQALSADFADPVVVTVK
jgi:hypothetical protein